MVGWCRAAMAVFMGRLPTAARCGAGTIFRLTIVPEFQALTLTNGTLTLTWSTEAGGIYQLQASASLNTPNWTNLGSPVTATNGTLTFTDSVTNAPQRFYRVSLAPVRIVFNRNQIYENARHNLSSRH